MGMFVVPKILFEDKRREVFHGYLMYEFHKLFDFL